MRIGVDIDGVLNDIEEWHLAYGTKFCVTNNIKREIHPDLYLIKDQFNLTNTEENLFWKQYIFDLLVAIPPRYFASEVIHKLREVGHEIIILSARNGLKLPEEYQDKSLFYIEEWLKKYNIEYDSIVLESTNKKTSCEVNNIDIMIEDKLGNVLEVSEIIPVLCFDTKYNQDLIGKNIIRVYSWYQIYGYLKPTKKIDTSLEENKVVLYEDILSEEVI